MLKCLKLRYSAYFKVWGKLKLQAIEGKSKLAAPKAHSLTLGIFGTLAHFRHF